MCFRRGYDSIKKIIFKQICIPELLEASGVMGACHLCVGYNTGAHISHFQDTKKYACD